MTCDADSKILVGHPLIHLGYAYELQSKEIATEALGMASVCYNDLHKYLDESSYTTESSYSTTSPLEILHKIHEDKRFDGLFDGPDGLPETRGWPTPPFPDGFNAKPGPYGITFTGKACSEPTLIRLAYAFEQATKWHTMHPKVDWA